MNVFTEEELLKECAACGFVPGEWGCHNLTYHSKSVQNPQSGVRASHQFLAVTCTRCGYVVGQYSPLFKTLAQILK
jgi:hypothetical protein